MSLYKVEYDYSSELLEKIMDSFSVSTDKINVKRILNVFLDAGLPIKVKHLFPDTPKAYYRILCFIKKSAESVIINTRTDLGKDGVIDGLSIQICIANKKTFDMLGDFTESIRTQIIGGNECRYCSAKCEGKRYEFTYAGIQYTKCRYLNSNFRLTMQNENDVNNIVDIIKNELALIKTKN